VNSEARTLLSEIARLPLSENLQKALGIAQRSQNLELARWCQLELDGYPVSNPRIRDSSLVPTYRIVAGQYTDRCGRPVTLFPEQDFSLIHLRNGVKELHELTENRGTVTIHDAELCELIHSEFQVEVFWYRFNILQLKSIFSAVRVELWNKIVDLDVVGESKSPLTSRGELSEPLWDAGWFGVNIRALRRWLKGTGKA